MCLYLIFTFGVYFSIGKTTAVRCPECRCNGTPSKYAPPGLCNKVDGLRRCNETCHYEGWSGGDCIVRKNVKFCNCRGTIC